MSSLWDGAILNKLRKKKPSPTCQNNFSDSARNPKSSREGCQGRPFVLFHPIKGISLFTFFFKPLHAGMTIEASIVLPLFLFFFLNLGCAIEMIRLHGNLQLSLWQIGSRLSVYGYAADSGEQPQTGEQEDGWWKELAGVALSSTFVKREMIRSAGKEYLDRSPITNGAEGLQFWESRIFGPEDEISIVATYAVSSWSSLMGFGSFRMANRYYSHIWNGYRLPGDETADGTEKGKIVYVTETGTVYHPIRSCTYLTLSERPIPVSAVSWERNQNGGKYYPCSICVKGSPPIMYYITEEGKHYHYRRECSGLKRTVREMALEHALEEGYRPCSRCGE